MTNLCECGHEMTDHGIEQVTHDSFYYAECLEDGCDCRCFDASNPQ